MAHWEALVPLKPKRWFAVGGGRSAEQTGRDGDHARVDGGCVRARTHAQLPNADR